MAKKTEAELGTVAGGEGTSLYGFQDPTGEFPREKYSDKNESSINRAARGAGGVSEENIPNDLTISASFPNIDLGLEENGESVTGRSKYPYNKVQETYSGHVIEIDDTEGNERILIRHRTGSGIEMRKDGTIYISATQDRYETVAGNNKIIVEGNTEIAYEGNVDMWVGGNFNLDIGGDYKIKTKGNKKEKVAKNHQHITSGNSEYTTKGNSNIATMGIATDAVLGDLRKTITKGKHDISAEGAVDLVSDTTLLLSGQKEAVMVSQACNISGITVSALGMKGTFGGQTVDFVGKSFGGPLGPQPLSGACFYGSVIGTASGAVQAQTAVMATKAAVAGSLGGGGFGLPPIPPAPVPIPPSGPPPIAPIVGLHLAGGAYAIRTVTIDAGGVLKSKILNHESYGGVFNDGEPSTEEARQAMRDPANKEKLAGDMAVDGIISDSYNESVPESIGRTSGKGTKDQFGTKPIGNTNDNAGKKYTVENDPIYTKKVGEKLTKAELLRAAGGGG